MIEHLANVFYNFDPRSKKTRRASIEHNFGFTHTLANVYFQFCNATVLRTDKFL
jgi:hypothetical protein